MIAYRLCTLVAFVLLRSAPVVGLEARSNVNRGVIRSANEASIASDLGTRVIHLPVREGESFVKGDMLVEFECDKVRAELRSAEAEHRGHALIVANNTNLRRYHAVGSNDVEVSKTQADKSAAAVDSWAARVAQCKILAPFDGRVAELFIHEYELPSGSNPVIKIVDHTHLEVDIIVPSRWLKWVTVGTPFTFTVDETGDTFPGRIVRMSAAVDPVSQTIKVIGVMDRVKDTILAGMSGGATFPTFEN